MQKNHPSGRPDILAPFFVDTLDLLATVFAGPGPGPAGEQDCRDLAAYELPDFAAACRELLPRLPAPLSEALRPALESFFAAWIDSDPAGLCASLATEHVRLFVSTRGGASQDAKGAPRGGIPAPPYHSCWVPGSQGLMGPPAVAMANRLAAWGLAPAEPGEPPDHLCAELELLRHLLETAYPDAADQGQAPDAAALAEAVTLCKELRGWLPGFVSALQAANPHPAYSAAGGLLLTVCTALADWLEGQTSSSQPT